MHRLLFKLIHIDLFIARSKFAELLAGFLMACIHRRFDLILNFTAITRSYIFLPFIRDAVPAAGHVLAELYHALLRAVLEEGDPNSHLVGAGELENDIFVLARVLLDRECLGCGVLGSVYGAPTHSCCVTRVISTMIGKTHDLLA